ncbi:hypothetical protein BJV82DRAFT_410186 [Fennellomyces sp. T-0311]|nr:hypothetical protein BJV82DRAFT_410186 [Fennellomyces sp. T-0311]
MKPPVTAKHVDNLMYLDDYIDNLVETVAKESIELINNVRELDPNDRIERLKHLGTLLTETLKRGEEKVALAKTTFDAVERHCNRLDADLVKFEEETPLGRDRITAQPGLSPSARSLLREVVRDKASRGYDRDRKDESGSTKKRKIKDAGSPPPGTMRQTLKEARTVKHVDKKSALASGKKSKTTVPADLPIDPNEPLYCYCQQVSYGEMVACDNADCEIEWFHLACVDLKTVPKGKWYCNNCVSKMKGKHRK